MNSWIAFKAQALTLGAMVCLKGLHAVQGQAFAKAPEAGEAVAKYLDQAHTLLQLAARHADLATPTLNTPVLAAAGGPKPKKA